MVTASHKDLSEREALFCSLAVRLGNPREAAVRAGYSPARADKTAQALLSRADIKERVGQLAEELPGEALSALALRGLARLAFGPGADAALLAFLDEPPDPDTLAGLDLFSVSEIRRLKGGGCEVKLFDRMKALELLLVHGAAKEEGGLEGLARALGACAGEADSAGSGQEHEA